MMSAVVTLVLLLCVTVTAQTAQQPQQDQTSLGSVLDKLKDPESVKQLQQALSVLQEVAQTKAQVTKPGDHKSVGDALDKGLDMAKTTVVYLAGKIEQVAPKLWEVLKLQQYVKGATLLINPFGFLIVVLLYRHYVQKWWKPLPVDNNPDSPLFHESTSSEDVPLPTRKGWRSIFTVAVPLASLVGGGIWFYSSITQAIGYFINPNYYALKDIIAMVRNPGVF